MGEVCEQLVNQQILITQIYPFIPHKDHADTVAAHDKADGPNMSSLINWSKVSELHGEIGAEDFHEVVELFMEEVEDTLSNVGKEGRCLEHDLHFLKGSALNLGFSEFSELCRSGEAAAANGDAAIVDVPSIQESYSASRAEFLEHMDAQIAP